jgi:hypothetical protein
MEQSPVSDIEHTINQEAPASWWVQVRGQAYGPYSQAQLIRYIGEGRVRPNSPVAQAQNGAKNHNWIEARSVDALMAPFRATSFASSKQNDEAANLFVHADLISGSHNVFIAALEGFGALCQLTPSLWLVRTTHGVGVIRNALSQTLERGDRFVVIDASRDRLAWFNLGPEFDVKIKDVWNAPLRGQNAPAR